jgi:hypothetical protein
MASTTGTVYRKVEITTARTSTITGSSTTVNKTSK